MLSYFYHRFGGHQLVIYWFVFKLNSVTCISINIKERKTTVKKQDIIIIGIGIYIYFLYWIYIFLSY